MARPDFWNNQESAQKTVQALKKVRAITDPLLKLGKQLEEVALLDELAREEKDEKTREEVRSRLVEMDRELDRFELRSLMVQDADPLGCFLSIQAGAGGTEACDWAGMLFRLYSRWAERSEMSVSIVSYLAGEEAGVRNATINIRGDYAFGYLKAEHGVHRLVRISPFDAQKRRHTSFASVDVVPEFEEEPDIEILDNDIRIDTYRAGGAGGQHVNMTDSAVRITHFPTGIVVQCQNERSQHKNKATAMNMLRSRLYQFQEDQRMAEAQKLYNEKGEIAFGSQIRSYVLQPYQIVKDHRTGFEMGNVDAVLDGDIDRFIDAYLRSRAGQRAAELGSEGEKEKKKQKK